MKKIFVFLMLIATIYFGATINLQADNFKVSGTALRSASHSAVQKDCRCDIVEWLPKTFDYVRVENNDWETLEVFSSRRSGDIWASDLAAYVKFRFDPSTGKYRVLEVDYYNPRVCKNYNY